jgi:hypothetical protein
VNLPPSYRRSALGLSGRLFAFLAILSAVLLVGGCRQQSKAHDAGSKIVGDGEKISVTVAVSDQIGNRADQSNVVLTPTSDGAHPHLIDVFTPEPGQIHRISFPEPPDSETRDAERLIHYFCRFWKDADYLPMYGALHSDARTQLPYDEFVERLEQDSSFNGGLKDERILMKVEDLGFAERWRVELILKSTRSAPRRVEVMVVRTPRGYRLMDSGIVPLDLSKL